MRLKYRSRSIFYNPQDKSTSDFKRNKSDLYFPSQLELSVFKVLENWVGCENILLQVPILLKPRTKLYPAIYWRCDFRILDPNSSGKERYLNIEAKGLETREFKEKMKLLEWQRPEEFAKLLLVYKEENSCSSKQIEAISLETLPGYLYSNRYFRHPCRI